MKGLPLNFIHKKTTKSSNNIIAYAIVFDWSILDRFYGN